MGKIQHCFNGEYLEIQVLESKKLKKKLYRRNY